MMSISESLQDGGWTGMIICISPTEYDINETVSFSQNQVISMILYAKY